MEKLGHFVKGKREVLVIEEKRGIIESQFKEAFYDWPGSKPARMVGKHDENLQELVPEALLPHAWRYVSIGKMQTSPALGIRMDYVHFTVWLMLVGLAVFAVLRVIGMLSGTEDGKPHRPEEE